VSRPIQSIGVVVLVLLVDNHLFREVLLEGHHD
jgi:hypothetical protein